MTVKLKHQAKQMQVVYEFNSEEGEGESIGNVRLCTRSVLLRSALLWCPADAVRPVLMLCLVAASCELQDVGRRTHRANLLLYGRSCPTRACTSGVLCDLQDRQREGKRDALECTGHHKSFMSLLSLRSFWGWLQSLSPSAPATAAID